MAHSGIGQFPPVGKHKEKVVKALLPTFPVPRGKALPLIVILHHLLQPGGTNPVLLFIDGVCLSDIGSKSRYLLGNGLSFRFRNQHTLLKVRRLGIPPGGINENLRHLPLAEIPAVRYADVQWHTLALRRLLCCPEFKSYGHTPWLFVPRQG